MNSLIALLLCAALLFFMGLAFAVPYEVRLYLCGLGVVFMYAAIIMALFVSVPSQAPDEQRRGRS